MNQKRQSFAIIEFHPPVGEQVTADDLADVQGLDEVFDDWMRSDDELGVQRVPIQSSLCLHSCLPSVVGYGIVTNTCVSNLMQRVATFFASECPVQPEGKQRKILRYNFSGRQNAAQNFPAEICRQRMLKRGESGGL